MMMCGRSSWVGEKSKSRMSKSLKVDFRPLDSKTLDFNFYLQRGVAIVGDKYIFIDRDGVINEDGGGRTDVGYIVRWEDFEFIPGVLDAFKLANGSGYKCIVISNQQCVGKGFCSIEDVDLLTGKMIEAIRTAGGDIEGVYYCPHLKEENCRCRKPAPGLFEKAREDLGINSLEGMYYIGDTERDIKAGISAGLKTALVLSGKTSRGEEESWETKPDIICSDLMEAVSIIVGDK